MRKQILTVLFIVFSLGCEKKKDDCQIDFSDSVDYKGYGIIKFNSSHTGSIRYMEFYPLCDLNIENFQIREISTEKLNKGIVIRENSNSIIWKKLISDKSIVLDIEKYGVALVYINFYKNIEYNKERKTFTNYLNLKDRGFTINMVDIDLYNVNTREFKIIKSL